MLNVIGYLREQQQISESALEEARHRAERLSESIEDALFIIGAVSEAQLLEAYRSCHNWNTVSLEKRRIDPDVLAKVSAEDAWAWGLLPLQFDAATNQLSLACLNPDRPELGAWLRAHLSEFKIVLYAAVGPVLRNRVIELYREQAASAGVETSADDQKTLAYIVSDRWRIDQFLGHLLSNEGYRVLLADSPAELLADLPTIKPSLVLIRKAHYACPSDYLSSFQKLLPEARIRQFENLTDLVDPQIEWEELVTTQNAHTRLAAAAFARRSGLDPAKATRLGILVDRMSQRLNLNAGDRMAATGMGYLFDIAGIQYHDNPPDDRQQAFFMLLSSAGDAELFPPATLRVVRQMYRPLGQVGAAEIQRSDFLIANMLTAADFYLQQFAGNERLTPYRYRTIEEHLRGQVGKLLLPEVVEALLGVIEGEVVTPGRSQVQGTVLVLDQIKIDPRKLHHSLENSGFEYTVTERVDAFVQRYRQLGPEVMVIAADGTAVEVRSLLDQLAAVGVVFANAPTLLLHQSDQHEQLYTLLRLGLLDIIRYSGNLEILDLRLQRISADVERASRQRLNVLHDMGTHGSLVHMNIIDLLQAMGPSNKTLRISVTAQARQLTIYLHNGQLVFAESDTFTGSEAVYEALAWSRGIWSVDHIDPASLPEPNVNRSIDSVLFEGVHRLDELNRDQSEQPAPQAPVNSLFQD